MRKYVLLFSPIREYENEVELAYSCHVTLEDIQVRELHKTTGKKKKK
jgi:hypothetical protein